MASRPATHSAGDSRSLRTPTSGKRAEEGACAGAKIQRAIPRQRSLCESAGSRSFHSTLQENQQTGQPRGYGSAGYRAIALRGAGHSYVRCRRAAAASGSRLESLHEVRATGGNTGEYTASRLRAGVGQEEQWPTGGWKSRLSAGPASHRNVSRWITDAALDGRARGLEHHTCACSGQRYSAVDRALRSGTLQPRRFTGAENQREHRSAEFHSPIHNGTWDTRNTAATAHPSGQRGLGVDRAPALFRLTGFGRSASSKAVPRGVPKPTFGAQAAPERPTGSTPLRNCS